MGARQLLGVLLRYRWLIVGAVFVLCVAAKLNGSSVGAWQGILKESGPIRGLLLFEPREFRADEWLQVTPSMLAQARHQPPFPIANDNLGGGLSPLIMSMPVAYYTTFFRPQLWGFFVFDFERGFSFYWSCKIFGLLLAWSWLLHQLGIRRKAIILFGTVWLFFSSYIQWWFSTPAMMPEMIASWAVMTGCALRMFSTSRRIGFAVLIAAFAFFGVNFVLCCYPAFQVPLVYISIGMLVAKAYERRERTAALPRSGLLALIAAIAVTGALLVPFYCAAHTTLEMVANTSYPGMNRSSGGALTLFDLFSGLTNFFESEDRYPLHYVNICEASNFYPLWVPVLGISLAGYRRNHFRFSPVMTAMLVIILFLAFYSLMPMPRWLARVSLLGLGSEERLLFGMGIANILFCCDFFERYARKQLLKRSGVAALVCATSWLVINLILFRPYADAPRMEIATAVTNAAILGLLIWEKRRTWFFCVFAIVMFSNGVWVNPVMTGLSPILDSELYKKVDQIHRADSAARWVVYEEMRLPQLLKATGASVLTGVRILPDMEFMREVDPTGANTETYNRFAYIGVGLPSRPDEVEFNLATFNSYTFTLAPEHPALRRNNYRYVVFPRPWLNSTLHEFRPLAEVQPSGVYIYERQLPDSAP